MTPPRGGLAPQTLRQPGPEEALPANEDLTVEVSEDGPDVQNLDDKGNILSIEHPDGSITISLDGKSLGETEQTAPKDWFSNLVDDIDGSELSRIAEDLLRGIDADEESRREWLEARTQGISLLGLKIEIPGLQGGSDGAPVEGMSKVRHPLLLESCLRFQANARSELLPTDGPMKIRNDDNNADFSEDQLAEALQKDMNHYLTAVATEYYPDTDRMLLMTGFGGCGFKKVNFCPLRNRPVSESVDAKDLIVNAEATDLKNGRRITHKIMMRPSVVKRLQILGVYRDIALGPANQPDLNTVDRAQREQQGVTEEVVANPDDRDREIYECYCELDIQGFEHKLKGKPTGLEIPYRVTIDRSSREILSVIRNYNEPEDGALPEARQVFVKYPYVPGMGFWDIGLLHILGNTTNAVTAAWREMLDNGMYANFPGFLIARSAARQVTNLMRVPPGGAQQVDTNGMRLQDAIMPLPYNTAQMAPLMSLVQDMAQTGQRIGGVAEMQVGEGRPDAPVGTTLALIEQATKIENAVHKRLHAAQTQEFALLIDCFREHPESFLQTSGRSKTSGRSDYTWDEATFLKALDDYELVPQADPNTASHTQRMMKIQGLTLMAEKDPANFNIRAVETMAIQAMGFTNPEQFLNPSPQTPPQAIAAQAKAKSDDAKAQAALTTANARMIEARKPDAPSQGGLGEAQQPDPIDFANLQLKQRQLDQEHQSDLLEAVNRERDRESKERIEAVQFVMDMAANPQGLTTAQGLMQPGLLERLEGNEPSILDAPGIEPQP